MVDLEFVLMLLLIALYYYMWSFGLLGLFLYVRLMIKMRSKTVNEKFINQTLDHLTYIGIFPSIILLIFIATGFFTKLSWAIIFMLLDADKLSDFVYGVIFCLLWWMPAVFLLIRKLFRHHKSYHNLGIVWFGIVMVCLICQLYFSILERIKIWQL